MSSLNNEPHPVNLSMEDDILAITGDILTEGELGRQLEDAGYSPGGPPTLSARSRNADRQAAAALVCPCCSGSGMSYRPYHCGEAYRVLCSCWRCGAAVEM